MPNGNNYITRIHKYGPIIVSILNITLTPGVSEREAVWRLPSPDPSWAVPGPPAPDTPGQGRHEAHHWKNAVDNPSWDSAEVPTLDQIKLPMPLAVLPRLGGHFRVFAFAGRPRAAFEIIWTFGPAQTGGLADYFLAFRMFSPFCLMAPGIFKSICYFGML